MANIDPLDALCSGIRLLCIGLDASPQEILECFSGKLMGEEEISEILENWDEETAPKHYKTLR